MREFSTIDWADALGRLHPILLHLPIGLLIALVWLRVMRTQNSRTERSLLWLLGMSSFGAAATGWLLHEGGNYEDPVEWHEWMGIALMVLCVSLVFLHIKKPKWYGRGLWLSLLLLFPTTHLGATLTHGEEFLTGPFMKPAPALVPKAAPMPNETISGDASGNDPASAQAGTSESKEQNPEPAPVAQMIPFEVVQPVLKEYCFRCHGTRKQKGELAMHTFEALRVGGDSGAPLVPGSPATSLMIERMLLPLDDEDHMPPEDKPQPGQDEFDLLQRWIESMPEGALDAAASKDQGAGPLPAENPQEPQQPAVDSPEPETPATGDKQQQASLQRQAMQNLAADGVHVIPIAQGSEQLWIDWSSGGQPPQAHLADLQRLAPRIVELSLAKQPLDGPTMQTIASMAHLRRLDLRHAQGPEGGLSLSGLAGHANLESINLTGVHLDSGAAEILLGIENAYVWDTGLPFEDKPLAKVLETEPEVVFAEKEPEEKKSEEKKSEVNSSPINTACPLTGEPIKSGFQVVFEDRTIGFCCAKCVKKFETDPALYQDKLPQ